MERNKPGMHRINYRTRQNTVDDLILILQQQIEMRKCCECNKIETAIRGGK